MVDPQSYFSFQPVLNDWYIRVVFAIFFLWDDAYKRSLAANQKYLSWTEESAKAGTCVPDRRALQKLALNVHVKH